MTNRDTGNLEARLAGIEKDGAYRVVGVLKDSGHSRTEKVQAPDGAFYIRKYVPLDRPGPAREYRILSDLLHPGLPRIYDYYELAGAGVIIEELLRASGCPTT